MKTLFLDLCSGISGDMFLGALVDLGADVTELERALRVLPIGGWHIHTGRATKNGLSGTRFEVHLHQVAGLHHDHTHGTNHELPENGHQPNPTCNGSHSHPDTPSHARRDARAIRALISACPWPAWVKEKSLAIFQRIAVAEGKIHGCPPDEVHFHEVGAVDSIIDVAGACLALDMLGRPRVAASPVVDGCGWINCAHGRYPVPAPATIEILAARGVPLSQCDEPHELVTPTGAALLAEFAENFGPMPPTIVNRVGYGLGMRDLTGRPNVLRVVLGEESHETKEASRDWETDTIAVLETNLDDTTPEILGHVADQMLASGALDVFFTPVQMKKGRPGILLTLLCAAHDADKFADRILRETSAFGVRRMMADRRKLRRELRTVATPFGDIAIKLGLLNGAVIQIAPEFESCRKAALNSGTPLSEVYAAARRCFAHALTEKRNGSAEARRSHPCLAPIPSGTNCIAPNADPPPA